MSISHLINEIVSEWSYRVNDGMPNPKNPAHLKELSEVLDEMGLSHIKNDLVKNLLGEAEEGGFKNPALNKKINYKNTKGEDAEGIVGNLLRLPAEHPGRKAAERTLPPEGSEERDALNKDLGGEGQPTKPEEPKGKEADKEGGADAEKEKQQQAQAMFDPKTDPAMGARLQKEKEIQAQLAKGDEEETPKEEPKKEEPKGFDPVPSQDVKEEIPQADPEVFGGASDIPDGIEKEDLKDFNTNISKVKEIVDAAKAKGEKAPDINLCDITVPGTNLYCDDNLGIKRKEMPQFKGKPVPGSRAEKMPVNKDGEVDTEPVFREMLKEKGITTTQTEVAADKLKATQSELGGDKVVGMMSALEKDPNHPGITGPVFVSRDGFVIDGHHRWAAIAAYNAKYPEKQIPMKCEVIDMDIKDAIPMCNKFAEDIGIAAKKQGETTGKAGEEQPKQVSSIKPESFTDKIKAKLKKWTQSEKEYFEKGYYKAGSEPRRTVAQAIKDKAKGAWKAIKDGFKHEMHEFKSAAEGVGSFFYGVEPTPEQKKAMVAVAKKVVVTALFGAAMGGLAYGAAGFAKHVAIEFVPHVVGETILKGAGRAAVFADKDSEAEMDANMKKFIEMIAQGLEDMEISQEQMEEMINSYEEKKAKGETKMEEPQMKEENLQLADELMLEMIYGFIDEANPVSAANNVLNQTVKNTETGRDIKVASALKYKDSQNKGQLQAYKAAVGLLKKAGVSDKELGIEKPKQIKGAGLGFRKTGEKELDKQKTQPTSTKPTKGSRIIGGKDKTLQKIDTLKSKEFTQKQIPDDSKFEVKNKKNKVGPPPPPYKLPKELYAGSKVPPRHLKALERMMNTKANNETAKWSYFSDLPGGAGQISAQAGELMTMVSTTLDDKQAQSFFDSLIKHEEAQIKANPDLKIEGKRIVTKSWIQAAMNNRKAIRNRLAKEYPGAQIVAGSWDTEGEVEAMGLKDYKKNKGFSTDAYFKIKTKDGQEILDEVSLKKSTAVNFLNSGTGKLSEWDPNISDDINPIVYQKNQRKALYSFGSKNLANLKKLVAKDAEFQELIKSKKIDLETAVKKLEAGKGSRDINKVVLSAIATAAKKGDKASQKYIQYVQNTHKAHQKAVISSLGNNPKLKQGMLTAIREEFPLKAVGEGEESMAIGPNSLDRAVLQNIFETSNFEQIKQGLFAVTNEEPPYLAYQAGPKGKIIPIATIVAREDGVGYGGQIKFEMQLDRRFAKILEQANKNIYG